MGMRLFRRQGKRVWYGIVYEDGRRIQRSTRCVDRKAAEAVVRGWERDAADPDHAAAQKATLSEALQLLVQRKQEQHRAGLKSAATVEFHQRKAGHLTRVFESDAQGNYVPFFLKALRAREVDAYVSQRLVEDASPHTIKKELGTLRLALKLAKRAGLWQGDLEAVMPMDFSAQYKPRTRALDPAELTKLLAELRPDHAARVAFIVASSARWGETERARWKHVHEDRTFVRLRGTKTELSDRFVPIAGAAAYTLLDYALLNARGEAGMLFKPWTNDRRDLGDACRRAGIEHCSPNDLRRTFATWLRRSGISPDLIAPAMGHADTRMVERGYGPLTPEQLR